MSSSIVVTDKASFVANAAENVEDFFCSNTFRSGALTAAAFTAYGAPPVAGVAGLGLVASLAFCPNEQENINLGTDPPFEGGQCPVDYTVVYERDIFGDGNITTVGPITATGPLGPLFQLPGLGPNQIVYEQLQEVGTPNQRPIGGGPSGLFNTASDGSAAVRSVSRQDGLPDDCGSIGGEPSAFEQPIISLPAPDPATETVEVDITIEFEPGDQIEVRLPFSNFRVDKLFPVEVYVDVGGVGFNYQDRSLRPSLEVNFGSDDNPLSPILRDRRRDDVLREIEECACEDETAPALETVNVAYPNSNRETGEGQVGFFTVTQVQNSLNAAQRQVIAEAAEAAVDDVEMFYPLPEQLDEAAIFSGTAPPSGGILFSPVLSDEIRSVRLVINSFVDENVPAVLAMGPNQRKFGTLAYSLEDDSSQSEGPFVWSEDTYFKLPETPKAGKVGVLLRPGTAFTLFDTGER